jgi:predicted nucleic acid-binding protein
VELALLASGTRIYLDTNVWIYALEGYPAHAKILTRLLERIDQVDLLAVTSELALAEALVKPLAESKAPLQQLYEEALQSGDGLTVVPITREVLVTAARLRAQYPALKLPDAIHAATAQAFACSHFLTNDMRFGEVPNLIVVPLTELR